jgi:hypothetical protein
MYLAVANNRLLRGGIFSLDGVHPTTMGYSLLAHEFMSVMRGEAGVPFYHPVTGADRPDPVDLDYAAKRSIEYNEAMSATAIARADLSRTDFDHACAL